LPIIDFIIKKLFYLNDNQILIGVDEVDDEDKEDHHMNMERICKKAEKKIDLKHNAMKLFKLDEDNKIYTVDVINNMRFFLAIKYVEFSMLFQQAAVAIHHAKDRLKVQKLGGINDHKIHNISQCVRVLVATNLNKIRGSIVALVGLGVFGHRGWQHAS